MKLIILLIVLGLERYVHIGHRLGRFNWFSVYLDRVAAFFGPKGWKGYLGVAVNILPIIIIAAVILISFCRPLHGILYFIISVIVLLYLLGPGDLFYDLENYLKTQDKTSLPAEYQVPYKEDRDVYRLISVNSLIQFNKQFFGVLFWFVITGVIGALFYRLVNLNRELSKDPNNKHHGLFLAANTLQDLLDWIPVRLLALGYALVGHFANAFGILTKYFFKRCEQNSQINVETGLAAIDVSSKIVADIQENEEVYLLIARTLILYLVVIAIFTLGAWIY